MKFVKISIVLITLLSLAVLGIAVYVFIGKKNEELRRIHSEEQLDTQKSENKKMALAYDQLTRTKREIEKTLQAAVNQEKDARVTTEKDLTQLRLDYKKISQEMDVLQQKYQDLRTQSEFEQPQGGTPEKLQAEIELPPVVVQSNPKDKGKILVVNRDFNFVVVDLGFRDQLHKGEFLALSRNNKPIGRLQAEKVYDQFAACGILEESKALPIQEGDLVIKSQISN
mgnify:CR=1 FL=1